METHKPNIQTDGGPWAEHDMPCAVHHENQSAVLDIGTGIFHPSWLAHKDGWRLIEVRSRWQWFCLRISGLDKDQLYTDKGRLIK